MIFYCFYVFHFHPNWLLKFDSLPQLLIRSIKTLSQNNGAEYLFEAVKGPTQGILQIRTSIP